MGGLVFDAVFEEQHESTLEVTDNPVETGVVISDHAFMKPLRLTIHAGVTDTPLNDDPEEGRSKKAFEALTALQARAEPFDVQTGLKLYKNMVCATVRTGQDKDTVNAFIFTADLREVQIVSTQTVKYPPRAKGSTAQQASKAKAKGEQQGKEPNGKQSIAKTLLSSGSSFFGKGQP